MKGKLISLATLLLALAAAPAVPAMAASATPLQGLPRYDHVFVLVVENASITSFYGTPGLPYLKLLASQGVFADHYYAIGHASLDNYIAMLNGQPDQPATGSDCAAQSLYACAQAQTAFAGGRNLADQMDEAGVSWKGYMDGTTQPCVHAAYDSNPATFATPDPFQGNGNAANSAGAGPDYADRHNPFLYFPDIVGDSSRCVAHVRPFTELAPDITANTLPRFGFITPDTCHDGHDTPCAGGRGPGGLVSANTWLLGNIPALVTYLRSHNGLLLITTDESATSDLSGCCSGGAGSSLAHVGTMGFGGRVGLVALGPGVKAGQTVTTAYDHASLRRTVESLFGISEHLTDTDTATAMTDLFAVTVAAPSPTPTPTPAPTSTPASGGSGGDSLPDTSSPPGVVGPWLPTLSLIVASLGILGVAAFGARKRLAKRGRSR